MCSHLSRTTLCSVIFSSLPSTAAAAAYAGCPEKESSTNWKSGFTLLLLRQTHKYTVQFFCTVKQKLQLYSDDILGEQ